MVLSSSMAKGWGWTQLSDPKGRRVIDQLYFVTKNEQFLLIEFQIRRDFREVARQNTA